MEIFHYVYVLRSLNDGMFYFGHTSDVFRRLEQHNNGSTKSTAPRRPFELIYFEAHRNKYDAIRREKYFKTTAGRNTIRYMIREYIEKGGKL